MKKLVIVVAAAALLLAGCSTAPVAPATEAETANSVACDSFAENTTRITDLFAPENGSPKEVWEGLKADFDRDSLAASGDVKERIAQLVAESPDVGQVYVMKEAREEVNELIRAVARACEADGANSAVSTYEN